MKEIIEKVQIEHILIFLSLILIMLALLIISGAIGDFNEMESLKEAEWLIAEYCNSCKSCDDCKKYHKKAHECMYKMAIPCKWKTIDIGNETGGEDSDL